MAMESTPTPTETSTKANSHKAYNTAEECTPM